MSGESIWQKEISGEDIKKIFVIIFDKLLYIISTLNYKIYDYGSKIISRYGSKFAITFFLIPSLGFITIFYFIPFVLTFLIGLTAMDFTFEWSWVGLQNFIRIINDSFAPKILGNTFFYVFTTLSLFNVGMALIVSLITNHIPEGVGSAIRGIWLLPRITPSTVYALLWLWAARREENALINWFLSLFGIPPMDWMLNQPWVIVILVNGFVGTSFGMIVFTAALKSIPEDYYRAARVDGASTWDIIRYIEIPMIKWPLLFVTAYQTLSLLTSFEYILILTDGGPGLYTTEVWSLYSYHLAFRSYGGTVEIGYGAALATILVLIGIVLSIIYWKVFRFKELMLEPKIEV